MKRLGGQPKMLTKTNGPVVVGIFDDGTIMVVGPNDAPVLIRHRAIMSADQYPMPKGSDIHFRYVAESRQPNETA